MHGVPLALVLGLSHPGVRIEGRSPGLTCADVWFDTARRP